MVVKALDSTQNPFSDFGNVVVGDRFIGRLDENNAVKSRVLGKNFGNLSVIGLPRVGKTSLVYNALMVRQESLLNEKKAAVFITMSTLGSSQALYRAIMEKTAKVIRARDENLFQTLSDLTDSFSNTSVLEDFLFLLRRKEYRFIVILDEFDYCTKIFNVGDF